MTQYDLISENPESTAIAEFEAGYRSVPQYQCEAEREADFIRQLNMSVDKVLALAQTIVTIQITLPQNKQTISKPMLLKRHQRILSLF